MLPPPHNMCVIKNSSTITTLESHHQQQRAVKTTAHSVHSAAEAGTMQSVSKGCDQMEAWEVKGFLMLMCACSDLLDSRSKVHVKRADDANWKEFGFSLACSWNFSVHKWNIPVIIMVFYYYSVIKGIYSYSLHENKVPGWVTSKPIGFSKCALQARDGLW